MTVTQLVPRAGELRVCLYCPNPLPANNREHVFNSCWGGTHCTAQLICTSCNSEFATIDHSFAYATDFLMNAARIYGQRQRSVPEIVGANGITLAAGAQPHATQPTLEVQPVGESQHRIQLQVRSRGEARRLLLDGQLAALLGRDLSDEERRTMLSLVSTAPRVQEQVGLQVRVAIDLHANYRSTTHTLLKCLGMFAPAIATSGELESARRFARNGQGNWRDFAIRVQQHVSPVQQYAGQLGWFNSVEIYFSRKEQCIIGVVTVLRNLKRAVVLGPYTGPDRLMFAFERVGQSQIRTLNLAFDETYPPVPFLDLIERPPTMHALLNEFGQLASNAVSWNATQETFYLELDRLFQGRGNHCGINESRAPGIATVAFAVCNTTQSHRNG